MKTEINKSVKRAISLVLAFVLLIGTLFTANVGVNIKAGAETESTNKIVVPDGKRIEYWDGQTYKGNFDNFEKTTDGKYIIDSAAKLQYVCAGTRYYSASNNTTTSTKDKSFVIDSNIYAFIMQPEGAVTEIGLDAFINASSAEETRILFEEKFPAAGKTPVNWITTAGIFHGNIDGNGVGIYGIYANGITTGVQGTAFFPATQDTDTNGIKVENLVIKNSYFNGYMRTSILSGIAWSSTGSYVSVDSCIFANCYLLGQNYYKNAGTTDTLFSETMNVGAMGVVACGMDNEPIIMSNTLVYGNKTEYDTYNSNYEKTSTTKDAFNWLFRSNKGSTANKGSVKNSIILDAQVNNLTANTTDYCSNVYSDTPTGYTTITKLFDGESTKGSAGMYWAGNLNWGTDWYAVEGEYPSPFMPDNYDPAITASTTGYDSGSGTQDDPYIISSADQLYQMVTEQSYSGIHQDHWDLYTSEGVEDDKTTDNYISKYYKVADGVDAIYINDVETKAEVEALVANGSYNTWNPTNSSASGAFSGNFDGNGATIYGMISTANGFVNKIDGENAAIKNVHFKAAHVKTSGKAAVIATEFASFGVSGYIYNEETAAYVQTWKTKNSVYTIANVVVAESHIETSATSTTDSSGAFTPTAAGLVIVANAPPKLKIENCLFDGGTCTLIDGDVGADENYSPNSSKAGICGTNGAQSNNLSISNCVSIGAYALSMQTGGNYNRYKTSGGANQFYAIYGQYNDAYDIATYDALATYGKITGTDDFTFLDMPLLNWGGAWTLETLADGRTIPMPKKSDETVDSYMQQILDLNGGRGMINTVDGSGYKAGTYGQYQSFKGSGTADDPYIISDALGLAIAIACGGKNQYSKLHYELACDINVGSSWISTVPVAGKYVYVPFAGTLDGKGHTVYNLYSVSVDEYVGLIPKIAEGATIKNLHIRDSYISANKDSATYDPGAFFGAYVDDPNLSVGKVYIEGCSYEYYNDDSVDMLVGNFSISKVTNSYVKKQDGSKYIYYVSCEWDSSAGALTGTFTNNGNGYKPTPEDADFYGEEGVTDPVWYIGGEEDSLPQLVNRAKAMSEVDISGYGDNDYDTNDITSLRQRLLNNPAYANVYGDVNRDGKTNLGDLVILRRFLVNTYDMYADGFWRNAALGNIVIYYGENDNYDFARKLELVLEAEFGKDVKKVVVGKGETPGTDVSWGSTNGGLYVHQNDIYYNSTNGNYYKLNKAATGAITPELLDPTNDAAEIAQYELDGNCQIVVGNVTGYDNNTLGDDNYLISYDKTKAAVWLQGGSFTAVEQATLDFISNSDPYNSKVYDAEGVAQTLDTTKLSQTFNGTKYYYAWGDEFDDGKLNLDNWHHASMQNETTDSGDRYENLEVAYVADMEQLYEVSSGSLKIWRGYYGAGTEATGWAADQGYKYLGTMADNIGTNEFGGNIEQGDFYVTAGKIDTSQSMLAKQGYIEFNVKYPSDGNVFACLWMYGTRLTHSNSGISNGLFGKVLKLNNAAAYANAATNTNGEGLAWDGTSNTMDSRYPSTYKYQMPNASYEIDIVELMQSGTTEGGSWFNPTYESNAVNTYRTANFTFHKYFDGGIYTDGTTRKVKFINWDSTLSNGEAKYFSAASKYSAGSYSTPVDTFLCDTVTNTSSTWNYGMKLNNTDKGEIFSGTTHQVDTTDNMMTIGVEWDTTNPTTKLFQFYVNGTSVGTVTEDIAYREDDYRYLKNLTKIVSDASTANQYMYLLIDNSIFTSETGDNERYTDKILTYEDGDTTVMEIDYVRVYQKDGKRDIVTPETEEFNNGNHFGY